MTRQRQVVIVLYVILALNLLVTFSKIIIGYITNSEAISSDGFASLSDSLSNVVGIIAITFASKPADKNHTYGHGKYETLASLLISGFLFFTAFRIIFNVIGNFSNPHVVTYDLLSFIVMVSTLAINLFVVLYETKQAKKLRNQFLLADAKHTLSDIYVTVSVIISMVLIKIGAPVIIDSILSFVIAGLILKTGVEIFKSSTLVLTDGIVIENDLIKSRILEVNEVIDVIDVKNRGNENEVFIEAIISVEETMSIKHAHEIVDEVENYLSNCFEEYRLIYSIHVEPVKNKRK